MATSSPDAARDTDQPELQEPSEQDTSDRLLSHLVTTGVANAIMPVIQQLVPRVLQALPQAIAAATAQTHPPLLCAVCVQARVAWQVKHRAAIEAAVEAARVAAGIPEGDPRIQQIDPTQLLPPGLQPGNTDSPDSMPAVQPAATMVNGSLVCLPHAAPQDEGGPRLLAATAAFNPATMLRQP